MSVNTNILRNELKRFVALSTPNDCNSSAPCSKSELTIAINNAKKLFDSFIDEIEKL